MTTSGISFDGTCFTQNTLSPSSVGANTTAEQTFTFPGLLASDVVISVSKPTAQAGLGIVGWRVSAANTLAITFSNNTGSPIVPTASQVYTVTFMRPQNVLGGADALSGGAVIFK
jgi:hypothetical protein